MIPFEFDFERPESAEAAFERWKILTEDGKVAIYYSGGTEIVTGMRKGTQRCDTVIDLKAIPEYRALGIGNSPVDKDALWVGGGVTLGELAETFDDSLFAIVAGGIADHTVRNTLTVGGNVCGRLPYKEMALVFLTLDAQVLIYGAAGLVKNPMKTLFHKRLKLEAGEILLGFELNTEQAAQAHYVSKRRQKHSEIDYPIAHFVLVRLSETYRVAISGVAPYVWYAPEFCKTLHVGTSPEENAIKVCDQIEPIAMTDSRASKDYKMALLRQDLRLAFKRFEAPEPELPVGKAVLK